jgi:hypothetical protein
LLSFALNSSDPFHEHGQLLIHILEMQDDVIQHVVLVVRASESFQTRKPMRPCFPTTPRFPLNPRGP